MAALAARLTYAQFVNQLIFCPIVPRLLVRHIEGLPGRLTKVTIVTPEIKIRVVPKSAVIIATSSPQDRIFGDRLSLWLFRCRRHLL